MAGAPLGNKNGLKKPWKAAIERALANRSKYEGVQELERLAEKLLDKAAEGDLGALKELGDRMDGKPAQTIQGTDGGAITVIMQSADAAL
jgi:hypothetical protein